MKLNKRQARTIGTAIELWIKRHVITRELGAMLSNSYEVAGFDWNRLAKYSFGIAVICIIIAVGAVVTDDYLIALIEKIFKAPATIKCLFMSIVAVAFYAYGIRRKKKAPEKYYSYEAIFFFGVLSTATAIAFFGEAINTGSGHFSILVLLAAVVYGILGIWFPSKPVWIFSLLAIGGWVGAETGYVTGWEAYWLGMNYPLRFVLFGIVLTAAGIILSKWKLGKDFSRPTLAMGLLYLFIALWIMSVFGNHGDLYEWRDSRQIELFHWSLSFGVAALCAIYFGIREEDAMVRGFGITFLIVNLYTRFFEYFWDGLHKSIFFVLLAASFWYIGTRAEKIWDPYKKQRKKRSEEC